MCYIRQCAKSFNDSVTMPPPDIPPRKRRLIEDNTAAPEAPTPKSGDRERSEGTNETPSTSKVGANSSIPVVNRLQTNQIKR